MGILDQILAAVDNTKRVASRNTKDLFTDTENFISKLTGQLDESNKKMASRDSESVNEAIANMIPGGGVGMIRRGGRTDLNMVHNIGDSLSNFVDLITKRGSVSNPSVAIAKDSVYPFSRSPTLIMNPASHSFDPGMNPLNQLVNRDMYATRAKVPSHSTSQVSFRRDANTGEVLLDKSFQDQSTLALRQGKDARFTEGGGPPEASQAAAIMASPRFKDLARYEKSSTGAKILTNDDVTIESEKVARAYKDWLNDELPFNIGEGVRGQPVSSSIRNEDNFKWLTSKANAGDSEAKRLLKQLQEIPSNYAELKVVGELGIKPKNISALLVPEGHAADRNAASLIRQFSDETGVRAGTAGDLLPSQYYDLYGEITDKLAEATYKTGGNLRSKYDALPQGLSQYVDSPNYLNSIDNARSAGEAQTAAGQMLTGSNKFAADVASILTASDLDATTTPNILKKLLENSQ